MATPHRTRWLDDLVGGDRPGFDNPYCHGDPQMVLEAALWRSSNDVITRLAKGCPWRVARGTGAFLLGSFSNAVIDVQETVRN
jgi:hypothetical protein